MHSEQHYLTPLFEPKAIAIIGASDSPRSAGTIIVLNILDSGYKGKLFFVNPKHQSIFGQQCYASMADLPQRVDLAVICVRAKLTAAVVEDCGRAGARSALIVASGFSDVGERGIALEQELIRLARRYRLRLLGPNSLGMIRASSGINLTLARNASNPGSVGFVSQSGTLCSAFLDWAQPNGVGFSSVISLGTSSDVDFGEALDYLVTDPRTENILLYIEGIKNARRFMSALRAAARCKPVLLIKVGRHPAAEQAVRSHTGALVGADDVFDAALRRAGVVRLATVGQMFSAGQALFSHFRPRGNRLAIITNGGGPGVMAADQAADLGLRLAQLEDKTKEKLDAILPPHWSRANPVDIGGDANPARYAETLAVCRDDPNVDGVLVILTPMVTSDPTQAARRLIEIAPQSDKPLVVCWMGEQQVREARLLFKGAGIPSFRTPEPAVQLFAQISGYYRSQKLLVQTPGSLSDHVAPRLDSARLVIETALEDGRDVLSEMESKALLASFHIPIAQTMVARSLSEAIVIAEEIGLPVAMKVDSLSISHKSDVGGVRLNLGSLTAIRNAYNEILEDVGKHCPEATINGVAIEPMVLKPNGRELHVAIVQDEIFGPVITLGPGGTRVDVTRDRAVALPPLNSFLVADLIHSTQHLARLGGLRALPPVSLAAIEAVLLRISEMVCELPWIQRLIINPLIVDENGAVAVDARIVVAALPEGRNRYDHMAIHPYPAHETRSFQTEAGEMVTIRPIMPEDADIEQEFVKRLSPESKYFRFMNTIRELSQAQLIRMTQIDYDREMAFVATTEQDGKPLEIGVARYATNPDGESCEFAIVVADEWHGKGLARHLMAVLVDTARSRGLKYMTGDFLAENRRMLKFVANLGFVLSAHPDDPGLKRGLLKLND